MKCDLTYILHINPNHPESIFKRHTDLLKKIGEEMMVNDCERCMLLPSGMPETQHGTEQESDGFPKKVSE